MKSASNLAFDVNPAEGFGSCAFKVVLGLAHLKVEGRVTLFEKPLSIVVDKELVRIAVGIKTKLLGNETQRDICLVTVPRTMLVLSV